MKKLRLAALTAAAVLLTAQPLTASAGAYDTHSTALPAGWTVLDDRDDALARISCRFAQSPTKPQNEAHFLAAAENGALWWVEVNPDSFRFQVRPDADTDALMDILAQQYPDIRNTVGNYSAHTDWGCNWWPDDNFYQIWDNQADGQCRARAEALLASLAEAQMLSAFYFGSCYLYPVLYPDCSGVLTSYPTLDAAAVQAFLDEQNLPFTVTTTPPADYDDDRKLYWVLPDAPVSLAEQYDVGRQLYEQFGLQMELGLSPNENNASSHDFGENALARPGDVNLDAQVNVTDAVLLARLCAEDNAVRMAAQGVSNGDVDADGVLTVNDLTQLLRILAGKE